MEATEGVLAVLAVSKAVSNITAAKIFYEQDLMFVVNHTHELEAASLMTVALTHGSAQVRFVQRPDTATHGTFKVHHLEAVKHSAHEMALSDEFCGVDKWFDNHFAYDQKLTKLDIFKANFDRHAQKYHIFGDCTTVGPGGHWRHPTDIYVVDPTGDTVQLNGVWDVCPKGGWGDALLDACYQGNCSRFAPASTCSAALALRCGHVARQNDLCTDCAYSQWRNLATQGCTNADVVNFCIAVQYFVA